MGTLQSSSPTRTDATERFEELLNNVLKTTGQQSILVPAELDSDIYDTIALNDDDSCRRCRLWLPRYTNIPCGCKVLCRSCLQELTTTAPESLGHCTVCKKNVKEIK